MTSLTDISEIVIGVDTHVDTHTAAIVATSTGGVLAEITVPTTPAGYQELLEATGEHSPLRVWAIEGTGGHGFGLSRLLEREDEVVIELDRPQRAKRRNGAKSDPLDAVRAAREAMARPQHGTPRTGQDRQALSVLLAARRSAVTAATAAQRQLFSLTIAAPERLRAKLRDRKLPQMLEIATGFRIQSSWDVETAATATVLRDLARRAQTLQAEADEYEKRYDRSSGPGGPISWPRRVWGRSSQPQYCAHGPTRGGCVTRPRSRCSPGPPRCRPTAVRPPLDTG